MFQVRLVVIPLLMDTMSTQGAMKNRGRRMTFMAELQLNVFFWQVLEKQCQNSHEILAPIPYLIIEQHET